MNPLKKNKSSRIPVTKLRDYIKELPVEQKQVLIMRHYLQMSFQEIAERAGVDPTLH